MLKELGKCFLKGAVWALGYELVTTAFIMYHRSKEETGYDKNDYQEEPRW